MIEVHDIKAGTTKSIRYDAVTLGFFDPDLGKDRVVPVSQFVVGSLDYNFISTHPYVYDRKNGYVSIQGEGDMLMRKLNDNQIKLIEAVLDMKSKHEEFPQPTAAAVAADSQHSSGVNPPAMRK